MVANGRKKGIASRRRVDEEGEEGGPDVAELEDDSLSEGTIPSDDEDEADAEASGSDLSEDDGPMQKGKIDKLAKASNGNTSKHIEEVPMVHKNAATADNDAMMNGLSKALNEPNGSEAKLSKEPEAIEFDKMGLDHENVATEDASKQESPIDRRKREHDDYKKKRDADPAFVPNRGAFFMHDHRHAGPAANGFRPFGRGRGRGQIGGPFSPANARIQATEGTDALWTHDMHEAVAQSEPQPSLPPTAALGSEIQSKTTQVMPKAVPPNRSFSRSVQIGNVQVRVSLPGMSDPITFTALPVKQHTRLPNHRPPLRRDKPVRISLPNHPPRYIFPAVERSFIFIPRAMRPNQQRWNTGRGRGGYGMYGGTSSRRTSVYGGSIYSPSVAMSRRSSLAHEVNRDSLVSPAGSTMSRAGLPVEAGKPVVRLPPSALQPHPPLQYQPTNHNGMPASHQHPYPLPEDPTHRENRVSLQMHQPRPQKTVSVADIESPASMPFHPPPQQQHQPFYQQVPHVNGHQYAPSQSQSAHGRTSSYPSQNSTGTPLSNIPERAIHAQPFQPPHFAGQFYPQSYAPVPQHAGYYYGPPPAMVPNPGPQYPTVVTSNAPAPSYVPAQPAEFVVPQEAAPTVPQPTGQGNMVAQEVNGMTYYYDSSQLYNAPSYPPVTTGYPMPYQGSVVGVGGVPTPSPDFYHYSQQAPQGPPVYYG